MLDEVTQRPAAPEAAEAPRRHWDESERLAALRAYGILDTSPEPDFDNIAQIAAAICETPIAVINFVEDVRQWFKSEIGLGVRETPLDVSICRHAILERDFFVVPDTTKDSRFACNPLVTGDPHLRFYAGALLETPEGLPLGTVCVLDYQPRQLTEKQRVALKGLARQVMAQLELRRALRSREEALMERRRAEEQQNLLLREMHHRVQNTLSTVQAIMASTARSARSLEEFQTAFSGRLISLARTHSILTQDREEAASLRDLLRLELSPYTDRMRQRVVLDGPDIMLPSSIAVPISMAIHELTTNAAKYGALSGPSGSIAVRWSTAERKLGLEWTESGGPPVEVPDRQGFGSSLLQRVLAAQIKADVNCEFRREGLRFTMTAPLAQAGG